MRGEAVTALASVVIPAHDEERRISGTLASLHQGVRDGDLEVVVVCNGCADTTAETVRAAFPSVRVLELDEASKATAVAAGNSVVSTFPRVHLDADVRLTGSSVKALIRALATDPKLEAVAPERSLDRAGCSRVVSWYYDVWEQLPQVRTGLFGRGVFVLTEDGQRRVSALQPMLSDDLVASDAFAPDERLVVRGARSEVAAPRRLRDLVNRRVRIVTGVAQATAQGARRDDSVTRASTLFDLGRAQPRLIPRITVFLAVTALARLRARRAIRLGDFSTWLRDESSRG